MALLQRGLIFILVCLAFRGFAENVHVLYVDDLRDNIIGKGTEQNPFRELQKAIDEAKDGGLIKILPGRYEAQPKPYIEEICGNCVNPGTRVHATRGFIVQGKRLELRGSGPGKTILVTNAGYGVLFEQSFGSMLTGVTITGGIRDPDGNATDAAVVAKYSRLTVQGVEIVDNQDRADDVVVGIGGIFGRENSELFILGNTIRGNGWDGVALYRGSQAVIADNEIAIGRGAGIGITWDASTLVYRNRISGYWKGIGTFGTSRAIVRNNAVFDNLGWGIAATGQSFMEVTNNVVFRNGNCGFARWEKTARGVLSNNIIVQNGWRKEWVCARVGLWMNGDPKDFPVTYNDVYGNQAGNYLGMEDLTGQDGNVSLEPNFSDSVDFHLKEGSPLIDAGDPLLTDPDGTRSDIGLYGGPMARSP